METIANPIKALRKKLSLTKEALADAIGVSFVSVNRWEASQTKPTVLVLKKLTEAGNAGF